MNLRQVMFIAGEPSGDTLGAELAKSLQTRAAIRCFGAGGPKMAAAGVELAFDLTTHAVVGIIEVLKNYGKFKRFFDQLLAVAFERKPDAVVLIDYPGFNLRFAKALKERARNSTWQPKIVYYVSPQIWAWHESRIEQIARDIDLLLAIFPFEKDWYAQRKPDLKVEFVGHPLIDRYGNFHANAQREPSTPKVLLLPGSRVRELRKHLPVMVEAAKKIQAQFPVKIQMVLPNEQLVKLAQEFCRPLEGIEIRTGVLAEALIESSVAIASSGTVTMECAYFRVPTVVLYKTSWSTYWLGRRFIKVNYLAMPNLLAGREIYPEFIQHEANGTNLATAALEFLRSEQKRAETKAELEKVILSLGKPGASERASEAILKL